MKRNIDTLSTRHFDVLIVGGGIHGAATARECARQGLQTALIERADFGGATSANSLKIIHGGLRYLQHMNIKRMRESIASRRIVSQLAPHLVKPLGCVIPNSGHGLQSNAIMRTGLFINDCIAFDRNRGIAERCRIPGGSVLPLARCKELFPTIDWSNMAGGSLWYEAFILNSERLTLAFVQDAANHGACVANYVEMQELNVDAGSVSGCRARDTLGSGSFSITAKTVVLTGGAWNDPLLRDIGPAAQQAHWAKAVNIIVRKALFSEYAIGLTGEVDYQDQDALLKKKGRFFFFVPWRGYTMIGTTYKPFTSAPDALRADRTDIEELLTEVNTIHPAARLTLADVTNVHAGLVPMSSLSGDTNGDVQLEKETRVMQYTDPSAPNGLFCVKSVKFTTAPVVAIDTCSRIVRFLGRPATTPQAASPAAEGSPSVSPQFAYLHERYGAETERILPYVLKNSERVSLKPPLCLGEIDYFLEEEMAAKVADVVFRRSELATAECPAPEVLRQISASMGQRLGWTEDRINAEIQEVTQHFSWA